MSDDKKAKMKATIRQVRDKLLVTKVVCTRSVKGRSGDCFVAFSTSVQEDGVLGLDGGMTEGEEAASVRTCGMTLKEATVAAHLLGMQADLTAHKHALAGSIITPKEFNDAQAAIKSNFGHLMAMLLGEDE